MTAIKIAAIALAGGKSSRMGADKALIKIDGLPMLSGICTVAASCGANPIYIVTAWPERYGNLDLPKTCQFIQELNPQGALMGFRLGLSAIPPDTNWTMLLACDLPALKLEVLRGWIAQLPTLPPTAIAYLAPSFIKAKNPDHKHKIWEPLCGFYRSSCLTSLNAYIEGGDRSFQGWLQRSPVVEISNFDAAMLFNCNTPADLERFKNEI